MNAYSNVESANTAYNIERNPFVTALRNSNLEKWEPWMELSPDGYVKCSLCSMKYADINHVMSVKHKRQIAWYQEKENRAAPNAYNYSGFGASSHAYASHYQPKYQERCRRPLLEYFGNVAVPINLRPWRGAEVHPGIIVAATNDTAWHPVNQLRELGFGDEMPDFMDLNDQGSLICVACNNKHVTPSHLASEKHKNAVQRLCTYRDIDYANENCDGIWAHGGAYKPDWSNANVTNEWYSTPWSSDCPPASSSNTAPASSSNTAPASSSNTAQARADPPPCAASSNASAPGATVLKASACSAASHATSSVAPPDAPVSAPLPSDVPVITLSPTHAPPSSSANITPPYLTRNHWPEGDTDDDEVLRLVVVKTDYDGVEWFTHEMPELGYLIVQETDVLRVSTNTIEDGAPYNRYSSYIFGQHSLERHGGWSGWVPLDIVDFVEEEKPSLSRHSRSIFVPREETA